MTTLRLITPPGQNALAVSLETVKKHLNVDFSDDDDLIEAYIGAATGRVEQDCRTLTVLPTTWALDLDTFCEDINLPRSPVRAVSAVKYRDSAGTLQTLAGNIYGVSIDEAGVGRVRRGFGQSWPSIGSAAGAVSIEFTAGFEDGQVPKALTSAILLIVGGLYAQRAELSDRTVMRLPDAVDALLARYRDWL